MRKGRIFTANKPVEAYIQCPFYLREKENVIMCEGCIGNTCMTTKFSSAKAKKEHLKSCCYLPDGGACPLAKSVFGKYAD